MVFVLMCWCDFFIIVCFSVAGNRSHVVAKLVLILCSAELYAVSAHCKRERDVLSVFVDSCVCMVCVCIDGFSICCMLLLVGLVLILCDSCDSFDL